jgi:hypothetical protein
VEAATRELNSQGMSVDAKVLQRSLEEGKYRVFFDGLDEAGANLKNS